MSLELFHPRIETILLMTLAAAPLHLKLSDHISYQFNSERSAFRIEKDHNQHD